MLRYVWRDLVRNPRRTTASVIGVTLGVGLFSGVLFFIDGSGASMTKRALAPLALDMQVVMNSPLGSGMRLDERFMGPTRVKAGQTVRVVLTVHNDGGASGNEVVVADQSAPPLSYVRGTTRMNGKPLGDVGGNPLSQGLAGTGLNIGTVPPGARVTLTYTARASTGVDIAALQPQAKISTRENVVPSAANAPPQLTLPQLSARLARIPGVAAVDGLAFVDLPSGALQIGGRGANGPVRLFGFDRLYQQHYPSIRLVSGAFRPGAALLSAEAAQRRAGGVPSIVRLSLPGRGTPLSLPVSGVVDVSNAKPLFYSRKSTKLEEFLYVPNDVVVDAATFQNRVLPAFRAAGARRGGPLKNLPLLEADILIDRRRLHADPAQALGQTKAIAQAVGQVAPGQQYLIDNVSNTLEVARDDAGVGKRMFLFLGLPGALLAAFLAAYTASVLAATQRREQANLRIRGAHRGHLVRMLSYRTVAFATAGAVIGTAIGLASVIAILGAGNLFEASAGALATSAIASIVFGMLTTALALYIPARRSLRQQIAQERSEISLAPAPAWRRLRLDFILLLGAGAAEIWALRSGAFDAPAGSVYLGQAVSLPSYLLLAPMVAWFGGILFSARVIEAGSARMPTPAPPRFGSLVRGTLTRSIRRRSWTLATGAVAVGLVIAFGTGLAVFTSTYDSAKAADARFTVGSDIRITPSVLSARSHPASFAARLTVSGIAAVSPVVFKLENAVAIGPYNEDRKNLAAIDPQSFSRVAALSDAFFAGPSAAGAIAGLGKDPQGVLLQRRTANDLQVHTGDSIHVLLARGTKHQALETFRVQGTYRDFPGFPEGADVIVNLATYEADTKLHRADFFLARATDRSDGGLRSAAQALRAGPGIHDPLNIETTKTTLSKDQSSLTALNVHGLVDLDSLYTLLMTAAGVGVFVFGLLLARRREYIALRAQGLHGRELQALVLGEAALVASAGLVAGLLVGTGLALLMVHVLRPLFILAPQVTLPAGELVTLAGLAMAVALLSAAAATRILRKLNPTEILREA